MARGSALSRLCDYCGRPAQVYGPWPGLECCDPCWQAWLCPDRCPAKCKKSKCGSDQAAGAPPAKRQRRVVDSPPQPLVPRRALPAHRLTVAPMVGGSELAFRLLCRRYGADLCYTPMMYSGRFVESDEYRQSEFSTCSEDRPLVAHFCGNDPSMLLKAARLVEHSVDAVDLNLGCPQRVAHTGHFGSYLLDEKDRPLLLQIVKELCAGLSVPVFCKIRLLDSITETLALCRQLQDAGCALLAVHARYRGTPTRRREGPADLSQVREIKKVMSIPVLSNGNTLTSDDVLQNLQCTGADGIMSAEGLLDNPKLFRRPSVVLNGRDLRRTEKKLRQAEALAARAATIGPDMNTFASASSAPNVVLATATPLNAEERAKVESLKTLKREAQRLKTQFEAASSLHSVGADGAAGSTAEERLRLALEYLDLVATYPVGAPPSTAAFHVRRMCKPEMAAFQLEGDLAREGGSIAGLRKLVERALGYAVRGDYVFDEEKARKEEEAAAFRKYERDCRKKFEARMAKKAKREGKDVSHYLKATGVPGGQIFGEDPSWLDEKNS